MVHISTITNHRNPSNITSSACQRQVGCRQLRVLMQYGRASGNYTSMKSTNAEGSLKRRFFDSLNLASDGWRLRYHWLRDWWEFVNVYTLRDLSFDTDKWPAFRASRRRYNTINKKSCFIACGCTVSLMSCSGLYQTQEPRDCKTTNHHGAGSTLGVRYSKDM
jgi:hypothetical protein